MSFSTLSMNVWMSAASSNALPTCSRSRFRGLVVCGKSLVCGQLPYQPRPFRGEALKFAHGLPGEPGVSQAVPVLVGEAGYAEGVNPVVLAADEPQGPFSRPRG